jgi:murein DD-endopeptidase MepM/ murein hydrolase activator NlpD
MIGLNACIFRMKPPAPAKKFGLTNQATASSMTVRPGDTVYEIAKRYDVDMRSLIRRNDLSAPYILKPGQRLKLPTPDVYRVQPKDTLYSISRTFGIDMTRLARINDLRSPYIITRGQLLQLPSYTTPTSYNRQTASASGGVTRESLSDVKTPDDKPNATRSRQPSKKSIKKPPPRSSDRFSWPVNGRVISRYGPKKGGQHNDGMNIAAPRGAPVRVAETGTVAYAGDDLAGYGNLILIRHADGWMTAYAHVDKMMVKEGETVKKGQTIATIGQTGSVTSPQLHFEVRRGSKALNPEKHLVRSS